MLRIYSSSCRWVVVETDDTHMRRRHGDMQATASSYLVVRGRSAESVQQIVWYN